MLLLVALGLARQATAPVETGSRAPDFAVKSIDGVELRLERLRGKVVVLNFWFIACPPCRIEMPKLNALVEDFKGQDVAFIGFSPDSVSELKEFLAEQDFKYTIVPDSNKVAMDYGVRGAPTHVVIDKEGIVRWVSYGAIADPQSELGKIIKELL